jgi:hypothetical protein
VLVRERGDRQWQTKRVRDADFCEEAGEANEWQADDRKEVAVDPLDNRGAIALDAIRAGFVQWLSGRDIGIDLGIREMTEPYACVFDRRGLAIASDHTDCGVDIMSPPFQASQHAASIIFVDGLIQDKIINYYDRVGGDHQGIRFGYRDPTGL